MGKKQKLADSASLKCPTSPEKEEACTLPSGGTLSPIAHPLADPKLYKKILKTVTKASNSKICKRGVKEVVKCIRNGKKGLVILAGDVTPMDVLSHLPVLCEDNSIPYVFVPSKGALGLASSTRRPTCCLMLPTPDSKSGSSDYSSYFEDTHARCQELLLKSY